MTPTDELVPLREEALRYLVGEPTTQVAPVDDIDALFADDDGRGAA